LQIWLEAINVGSPEERAPGANRYGLSGMWFWVLSGVGILLLVVLWMDADLSVYDEGLVLYGAANVLRGEFPWRDFWSFYGPGQYYLLAALFHIFGMFAIVGRALYSLTMLVSLLTVIRLQSVLGGKRWLGVVGALVALLWASAAGTYLYPVYTALSLILVAALCLVRHWQLGTKRWICMAGALIGVVVLFRHDLAIYSFLAICAAECYYHLGLTGKSIRLRCIGIVRDVSLFAGCILIIAVPPMIFLFEHVPFADVRYQMFYIPSRVYPLMRRLPLYSLPPGGVVERIKAAVHESYALVPMIVPIAALSCLLQTRWREQQRHWQATGYVLLMCLAIVMPISAIVRPDLFHVAPALMVDALVLSAFVASLGYSGRFGQTMIVGAAMLFSVVTIAQFVRTVRQAKGTVALLVHPGRPGSLESMCHPPAGLERTTCLRIDPVEEEEAEYIESHTMPGDKIYVGAGRHDKLYQNDILFYFIARRDAGTKWYYLEPGLETTYPIQTQMIQDLDNHHVNYVVRNMTWDGVAEPNDSRFSSGVTILDQYIDANYKTVASYPQVQILHRTTPF
jgi:hypothetical protein